ncbi:calcium-activated potassium channel slo-1-like [Babylonia areolata]|uniref:calcium-activated potassium channel slo-1-like n=1 Tax=Babylonia areolata TaxID=304850 RepID=UPI003FD0FAB1
MAVATNNSTSECIQERHWYAFLASSLIFFSAGLVIILIYRLIAWFCCRKKKNVQVTNKNAPGKQTAAPSPDQAAGGGGGGGAGDPQGRPGSFLNKTPDPEIGWMTEAKDWAGELISGQTTTGRILVGLVFLLSIASLIIYFIDASLRGLTQVADASQTIVGPQNALYGELIGKRSQRSSHESARDK